MNNLTPVKLILYTYLFLELFLVIPYLLIIHYFNIKTGGIDFGDKSEITILFIVVIFGPLLETLIFQTLIINLVKKGFPKINILSIITSAILFSLSHFYSLTYVIYTFFIGIILAYIYILSQEKRFNPFLIVFSIHALHNLTMFYI